MDGGEDAADEVFGKAQLASFRNHIGQEGLPAAGLEDGDVVLLFILTNLPADCHTGDECLEQLRINVVDSGPKG